MNLISIPATAELLDGTERHVSALIDAGELDAVDTAIHRDKPGKTVGADGKKYSNRKRRLKITAESVRLFLARRLTHQERPARRRRRKSANITEFF